MAGLYWNRVPETRNVAAQYRIECHRCHRRESESIAHPDKEAEALRALKAKVQNWTATDRWPNLCQTCTKEVNRGR